MNRKFFNREAKKWLKYTSSTQNDEKLHGLTQKRLKITFFDPKITLFYRKIRHFRKTTLHNKNFADFKNLKKKLSVLYEALVARTPKSSSSLTRALLTVALKSVHIFRMTFGYLGQLLVYGVELTWIKLPRHL